MEKIEFFEKYLTKTKSYLKIRKIFFGKEPNITKGGRQNGRKRNSINTRRL